MLIVREYFALQLPLSEIIKKTFGHNLHKLINEVDFHLLQGASNLNQIMNMFVPVAGLRVTWGYGYWRNNCETEFVMEKCPVQKPHLEKDTHSCWVFFVHLGCGELFKWSRVTVGWKSRSLVFSNKTYKSQFKHFGKQHIVSITCTMHTVNHVVPISNFLFFFSLCQHKEKTAESRA